MKEERSPRKTAALTMFLLFAAVLPGVTPVEASIPRGGVADGVQASLQLHELAPPTSAIAPSRFGFAERVPVLDVEGAPGCFGLFGLETSRCERTYARNNPLKYVDPDGRQEAVFQTRNESLERAATAFEAFKAELSRAFSAEVGVGVGTEAVASFGPISAEVGAGLFLKWDTSDSFFVEANAGAQGGFGAGEFGPYAESKSFFRQNGQNVTGSGELGLAGLGVRLGDTNTTTVGLASKRSEAWADLSLAVGGKFLFFAAEVGINIPSAARAAGHLASGTANGVIGLVQEAVYRRVPTPPWQLGELK